MFGVSTFCLHEVPLAEALEKISGITNRIEVMDEGKHFLNTTELLLSYKHSFSIHSPCRGTNISSLLEPIRRASVEVMAQCFSIASEVNAPVVVHPGYFAWTDERGMAERQLQRSLAELSNHSREYSVPFFIENMGNWDYFFLKTPAELPLIGDCAFALDVGHAHQNNCLTEFLRYPAAHYHLHDNTGKDDSHDAVGNGSIDFTAVMTAVRASGVVPIIEVASFESALTSIERLRIL